MAGNEIIADDEIAVATKFATELARGALAGAVPGGLVLNVNVPPQSGGRFRWTRLGKRHYEDDVHHREDPRGKSYYWIGGVRLSEQSPWRWSSAAGRIVSSDDAET